jgi:hypothetical protein
MAFKTHGKSYGKTYRIWANMKHRCTCDTHMFYRFYGGAGITVCERWQAFENFYADMGECPVKHSLDRIDNKGNYEPINCRWATSVQQARNKSNTRLIVAFGKSMVAQAWADELGLHVATIKGRIKRGWPIESVLTEKPNQSLKRTFS